MKLCRVFSRGYFRHHVNGKRYLVDIFDFVTRDNWQLTYHHIIVWVIILTTYLIHFFFWIIHTCRTLENDSAKLSNRECFLKNDKVKISYWISSPYLMQIVIFELTSTVTIEIDRHVLLSKQTTHLQRAEWELFRNKSWKVNEHLSPRSFDVSNSCRLFCVCEEECFDEDAIFFHEGQDFFSFDDSSIIAWCDDKHSYYGEQIIVLQ